MRQLPAVLSLTEFAALLGVRRHVVRDHAAAGRIPTFKMGRRLLVSMAKLRKEFPDLWEAVLLKSEAYDAAVFNDTDEVE